MEFPSSRFLLVAATVLLAFTFATCFIGRAVFPAVSILVKAIVVAKKSHKLSAMQRSEVHLPDVNPFLMEPFELKVHRFPCIVR